MNLYICKITILPLVLKKWITIKIRVCLDKTYFVKTENWKHCSKIIFKCVNSTVRPIYNEKVDKKLSLWDPWTIHLCTVYKRLVNSCGWRKKKKKRENADAARLSAIQRYTKGVFGLSLFLLKLKTETENTVAK